MVVVVVVVVVVLERRGRGVGKRGIVGFGPWNIFSVLNDAAGF